METTEYGTEDVGTQPIEGTTDAPSTTDVPGFEMPEKFRGKSIEDVVRSYQEQEKHYGTLNSLKSELEQHGGIDTLKQWAQVGPQYVQAFQTLAAQMQQQQAQQAQPAAPAQDPYGDWEMLTPREQAQRQMQVMGNAVTQYINHYGQQALAQMQQQQAQALQGLNAQWDIWRRVSEVASKKPGVDMNGLLENMKKIATGDVNSLITLATNQMTNQADVEAKIAAEVNRRLADAKIKAQNTQVGELLGSASAFKPSATNQPSQDEDTRALMRALMEQGLTASHF